MKHLAIFSGAACAFMMTLSLANAQTTSATPSAKPPMTAPAVAAKPAMAAPAAAKPAAAKPAAAAPATRTAKSKECSMQADQKGLHGKERKKFRDACKKA